MTSTFLVTPTLRLEGNWLAHRFGWKYVLASVLLALFAFASPFLGIVVGTMSCVMAFSNMQMAPLVRHAGGEAEFARLVFSTRAAASFSLRRSILDMITIPLPVICLGAALLFAKGVNDDSASAGVAYGLLAWGAGIAAHRAASLMRICKRRRSARRLDSVLAKP